MSDDTNHIEPKPCPFCGKTNAKRHCDHASGWIGCECGASGPRIKLDVDRYPGDSFRPNEEQKAVSAWNRRALSARASAGEGGDGRECDCGANAENKWPHHDDCGVYSSRPAQAGASGGDWICGFCKRTYTLDAICCDKQRVHRRTTPQPVAASEWMMVPRYPTKQMEEAGAKFAEPSGASLRCVAMTVYASMLAAAPQPQQAPVPVRIDCPQCTAPHVDEGEWATRPHKTHQCQACGHEWRPFPYATVGTPPAQATVKESLTVHPAHGDGEGEPVAFVEMVNDEWQFSTLQSAPKDALTTMRHGAHLFLTTRPSPEAQEARDAARYRWLRLPGNATVYARDAANFNEVPHHPGGHFRYVEPANLDAAIDAALALPAQGEGNNG